MGTHRNLQVWENGIDLVVLIYQITSHFPKHELFGLVSQLQRAAVSIPANISEGAARNHSKEFIRFLRISFGSLSELETLILIAVKIQYINKEEEDRLFERIRLLSSQLSKLISAIEKSSVTR